jgi:hypothetical protein
MAAKLPCPVCQILVNMDTSDSYYEFRGKKEVSVTFRPFSGKCPQCGNYLEVIQKGEIRVVVK